MPTAQNSISRTTQNLQNTCDQSYMCKNVCHEKKIENNINVYLLIYRLFTERLLCSSHYAGAGDRMVTKLTWFHTAYSPLERQEMST